MQTPGHLTSEQIAGYQARTLDTAGLLAVGRHLAECEDCRNALYREIEAEAQLSALRTSFSEHLAYDQVVACAEGSPDPALAAHLNECAQCRTEVEDLREFRDSGSPAPAPVEMPRRRPAWAFATWSAAAAAIVVAAGITWWYTQRPTTPSPAPVAQTPAVPAEPELAPDHREAVQLALSTQKLERAPVLDQLIARRGVLLGDNSEPKTFDLNVPVGTTVIGDRPVFRWQPLPGATSYKVSVFDENFNKVTESPAIRSNEWQPERPLARGRVYVWQVSATVGSDMVRAPVPPAPEARFQVVSADAASAVEKARQEHPSNHLLLAVLLAKAGALDETSLELDALASTDSATAHALRESLSEIRRR